MMAQAVYVALCIGGFRPASIAPRRDQLSDFCSFPHWMRDKAQAAKLSNERRKQIRSKSRVKSNTSMMVQS